MQPGDLVVMPRKDSPTVAIGRVTGPYEYRAEEPDTSRRHVRPVEWLRTDVPRSEVRPDLEASVNTPMTYCELNAGDASLRVARLARGEVDPGVSDSVMDYWLVNKPAEVSGDNITEYLAEGVWRHPFPGKHTDDFAQMQTGQSIGLKVVTNRTYGLPFFNADKQVSTMTIFATGRIAAIERDSATIQVTWNDVTGPRDWYFYTNRSPIWHLAPASDPSARMLSDFVFRGVPQDLSHWLADPYWSTRFMPMPAFTWIPFYEEFASRLLAYRDDRGPLLDLLRELSEAEPKLRYLNANGFLDGVPGYPPDIDPFTIMGSFNRGITKENRQSIAELMGRRLGVTAPVPDDFAGIPVLNNMKSWFTDYSQNRGDDDVEALWRALEAAVAFADDPTEDSRSRFVAEYDTAHAVRGVKWNLSVGLYWARPHRFMTLDSRSRPFIRDRYSLADPTNSTEYLSLCDTLLSAFGSGTTSITSFPLLSLAAWMGNDDVHVPHTIEGMATWAARVAVSLDLNEMEHQYKRDAAFLAAEARDQAHRGEAEWPATLKQALKATNTINWMFADTVNKAVAANPATALAVLDLVWADPDPDRLDAFQDALRSWLGKVTPGNATALGSLLLMADDPEANAPYNPSRTERWYELTGFPGPKRASSATSRYRTMIEFLDALAAQLPPHPDSPEPTRLEVQGMAWATTESNPPADWDEAERQALIAWRGSAAPEDPRAWLARTTAAATNWLGEGYVSMAASYLGALEPGASLADVKAAIEAGYQHQDYSQRKALVEEYYAFLSVMKPGDVVAAIHDAQLHVGLIEGPAEYVEDQGDRLRRAVAWQNAVPVADLSSALVSLMDRQGSVVDITEAIGELRAILDGPGLPPELRTLTLAPANVKLADELFMPAAALQEIIDLLGARKQIVLYGPPGTGKTFIAKAIARHVIGTDNPSQVQLVQFHPSYAYEDFFEGYRPYETDSGQASFTLQPGPLARIARDARADKDHPYVLVIDEMNRANLAKVFGELYFLLEYRNESIQLQYRPTEAFRLPDNLFIIGTMNTADRSIALLDAAMRRRFSFVELHPDDDPVKGVLPTWLSRKGHSAERAQLLDALNAAIEDQDRDLRIGPSYLMRSEAETDDGLARVWKYDIMPLLEEQYYGRLSRDQIHARFGLAAIRSAAKGETVSVDGDPEPDELFEGESSS
jgi:predicted Mrr-cat superfamily restriction endonuclease